MKCVLDKNRILSDGENLFVSNEDQKQIVKLEDIHLDKFDITSYKPIETSPDNFLENYAKSQTLHNGFSINGLCRDIKILDNIDDVLKDNAMINHIPREKIIKALYKDLKKNEI